MVGKTKRNRPHIERHRQISKATHERKRRERQSARRTSIKEAGTVVQHQVRITPGVWGAYAEKQMGLTD